MWLVTHINIASAERHYLLPNYVHVHCLVYLNIEQVSMNINFFNAWRNVSDTFIYFFYNMPFYQNIDQLQSVTRPK